MTSKREKFDSIYRAYKDDVYKISYYYTNDKYVAQEIAQNTFLKFYKHIEGSNIENVRSYLYRIARNLAYNYARDMKYEQPDEDFENLNEDSVTTVSVEEVYLEDERRKRQRELGKHILEGLREENELWYEAVNLVCCLEKPQDVVATELGISKDALSSRLHRARRWIQKNYDEEFDEVVRRS